MTGASPGQHSPMLPGEICDYQVQCDACWRAADAQHDAWFGRHRVPRSMARFRSDDMRDADHAEALAEN